MDVLLYFGGGGALGAFDAGVWCALAPRLRTMGARLLAVGGASIGAINAACVARHGQDWSAGASALEAMWTRELVTPSFPFNGLGEWGDRDARSWNGVLTGLLLGNRRLYRSEPLNWNPGAGMMRGDRPLLDRTRMHAWIAQCIGSVPVADEAHPLCAAAAVDVLSGDLVLFDNAQAPLNEAALLASSAIPLLFEPIEIDGRLYWDGDMTRESALPAFATNALHARGNSRSPTLLICVDHMSRATASAPRTGLAIAHRVLELLLHGKTQVDDGELPGIDRVIRITRASLPQDPISGQFDYSPERMIELVNQGRQQAEAAWGDAADAIAA